MNIKLKIWRQKNQNTEGHFEEYSMSGIEEHMSFLEVLDLLNEQLFQEGKEPVAFDSDCREGICGQCGVVINGQAHGPIRSTTCQLHMRHLAEDPSFKDGDTITIEPWRSAGFPILKDLVVDRSALDRIVQAGGYIWVCSRRVSPSVCPVWSRCSTSTTPRASVVARTSVSARPCAPSRCRWRSSRV